MKWILTGVDGSPESFKALKFAAELARPMGCGLRVVTVAELAREGVVPYADLLETATQQGEALIHDMLARAEVGALPVQRKVLTGPPGAVIADAASAPDVEMVAVGHRGRNGMARVLLGSVADQLVQISPKPVLVVR